MVRGAAAISGLFLALLAATAACAQDDTRLARLGVLAHRGPDAAASHWQPLADYLTSAIDGWQFEIQPITLISAAEKITSKQIDFLITNPGHFIALAEDHSLSAIATREQRPDTRSGGILYYGTVILVRSDSGVDTISGLKGKELAAVSPEAFGGFQLAWNEMVQHGVDPFSDLRTIRFMGFPQDAIIDAVAKGEVDAGIVRSGLLENLNAEGRFNLDDFTILNSRSQPGYLFQVTGHLYPEWPFVVLPGVDKRLREAVASALLATQAPETRRQFGLADAWSTPLSYESVRQLVASYQMQGRQAGAGFSGLIYVSGALLLLLAAGVALWVRRSRRRLPAATPAAANLPLPETDPEMVAARDKFEGLTPREREVLALICAGEPSKLIASELGISLKTVEYHRANLIRKTDAGSTAHLVQIATRLGYDLGFTPA